MRAHAHALFKSYLVDSLLPYLHVFEEYTIHQKKLNHYYELKHVFTQAKVHDLKRLLDQETLFLHRFEKYYTQFVKPHERLGALLNLSYGGFHLSLLQQRRILKKSLSLIVSVSQQTLAALREERTLNNAFKNNGLDVESFLKKKKALRHAHLQFLARQLGSQATLWKTYGRQAQQHSTFMHTTLNHVYRLLVNEMMHSTDKTIVGIKNALLDKPFVVHQHGQVNLRNFLTLNQWVYQAGGVLADFNEMKPLPTLHASAHYYAYLTQFRLDYVMMMLTLAHPPDVTAWYSELDPLLPPIPEGNLLLALEDVSVHMHHYVEQHYLLAWITGLNYWLLFLPTIPVAYRISDSDS